MPIESEKDSKKKKPAEKGAQEANAIPLMASGPSEVAEATVPLSSTAAEAIPDQDRVHPSRKLIKNKKMSGASGGLCLPKAHHQLKQVITPQCLSEAASSSEDDMLEEVCYFGRGSRLYQHVPQNILKGKAKAQARAVAKATAAVTGSSSPVQHQTAP